MRSRFFFLLCLVCLVPFLGGCLVRTGVAVVHEHGKNDVSFDGQLGIHPLGLVHSVAPYADAGVGINMRSAGPIGFYVEGAAVTNRTPLAPASGGLDVFELRQMVALDATLMASSANRALHPGVDVLLVTEAATFSHVNTKRDFAWGEMGAGLYVGGRFDRTSFSAAFGVQTRLCGCIPHD